MKLSRSLRFLLTVCGSSLLAISSANAATLTWDAGGGGGAITNGAGAWLGANLWNNGGAAATWTSGDDAIFAGPATAGGAVTLASPTTVNSITFNPSFTGTYTLGTAGQAITLNNGITKNAGSGLVTIVSPITLGASQTWTNNSTNKLQISSLVTTSLGQTLTFAGTGEFNFPVSTSGITGAGSVIVDGAYLNLISGGNQANNTYTGTTTVQNGGEILYYTTGPNIGTGNITLNGGILSGYFNQGFTRAFGTGSNQFQITGGESGFGVNGASTINFSNVTSVQWGSASFSPSKFVLGGGRSGGTVTFAENIDLNNADRTVTTPVGSGGGVLSGALSTSSGTAGLIKEGAGTLALSTTNTYNGGTTISAGTLRFDTRLSMPATGTVTVADGATLAVTVAGSGTTWGSGTGVAGIAGLTSTANSGEGYGGQTGALVNFNGNSSLNLNVTGVVAESNAIGDGTATSIRLIKSGASNLTLSGPNSYSGGTTLSAGALIVGSNTAIPNTGTIALNGGTIQSNDATARSFSNAVTIGGDFTVGGTGNLTFSNTGASALGSTRTITVTTGSVNATFAQAFSGSGAGITKAGAGTLTLTGNNSYTGATTINAGSIVLNNDGDVTGSAVTFGGNNTGLTITGGSGVTSIWNAGGGNFGTSNNTFSNLQVLIDGAGTAGSARVTNVGTLIWGRTTTNSTILLTNGGQMNVNGEIRIGNPYYNETGGANLTIGGGTATSTFTGNNPTTSNDFYIGYGERTGSKNNVVTVSSGGVLTGIRDMVVGHVFDAQNNANPSTNNQLLVTGTGTASMRGISLGFANAASSRAANANIVSVTGGGTLTSTGAILIGRANLAGSQSNSNTMTVSGTGSTWNAGNQNVIVGSTNNATAVSNNNILTVGLGAVVSNVAALTVGSGSGTETGNQLVVNGSLAATSVTVNAGNRMSGSGTINGAVTVAGIHSPGNSPGIQTFGGNLSYTTGASVTWESVSDSVGVRGTDFDGINVGGGLDFAGATTIDLVFNFAGSTVDWQDAFWASSHTGTAGWLIYDVTGTTTNFGNLSFTVANWLDGSSQSFDSFRSGNTFSLYQDGNDIYLNYTAVPEPRAALLGGLGLLMLLRRRR